MVRVTPPSGTVAACMGTSPRRDDDVAHVLDRGAAHDAAAAAEPMPGASDRDVGEAVRARRTSRTCATGIPARAAARTSTASGTVHVAVGPAGRYLSRLSEERGHGPRGVSRGAPQGRSRSTPARGSRGAAFLWRDDLAAGVPPQDTRRPRAASRACGSLGACSGDLAATENLTCPADRAARRAVRPWRSHSLARRRSRIDHHHHGPRRRS